MKRIINQYKYIIAVAIISLVTTSCEKEVDVDLRSVEPRLVIEAKVIKDMYATVRLTKTKDFDANNDFPPVKGAVITITDDAGNFETLDFDEASGLYTSKKIIGVERRTYNLSVVCEGMEYTSTSKMPPLVPIDSLTTRFMFPGMDYPYPMVHFQDPIGEENNYYRHLVYVNGKKILQDDLVFTSKYSDGEYVRTLLSVRTPGDDDPIENGDLITVEHQCLDKDAYTFFETLSNIDNSLNNPTTNIVGGALGYFSAFSVDKKDIIAKW